MSENVFELVTVTFNLNF